MQKATKEKMTPSVFFKRIWRDRVSYMLSLPFMILFLVFTVLPVLMSVVLGFTYFNVLQPPKFILFDNYIRLFLNDEVFLIALKNTFILACITGPISYLLCFGFAWGINELSPKIRAVATLCFYAPSIAGNVYLIWTILFNSDRYGMVNGLLLKMGIVNSPILFFQDPKYMMPLVIVVVLWMSLGTSLLVFVAGFQGVDRTLYEAGAVDGIKNRFMELWYVTLPSMKPQLMFGAIMSITSSFGMGSVVNGLVGFPSTDYAVHTIMHHLEDYGSIRFEMGYASAIATVLFILMLLANMAVQRIIARVGK